MQVAGKAVWITGASAGIGEALAIAFADAGCRLLLSARRADALARVAERCAAAPDVQVLPLDVTDPAAVDAALAKAESLIGPIDVLVNNAGVTQRSSAAKTDMAVYRSLMEVNYFGAVALTRAVLPGMLERGQGQIVAMSSVAGKVGAPLRTGYCGAKHALVGYCDALRAEVHDRGVRVLVVCPGFVKTDISYAALKADGSAHATMDDDQAAGVPAEQVAARTLRAIEQGDEEILVGGKETLAVSLKRVAPGLLNKLTRKVAAQRMDAQD
ncbi:SDR family oxidoreductase [bacterium]|nr:SDR family oxidoreductase [bacterium]